jgi:hypothetical protein
MGVYPFMFGATKDFQPVVDELVKVSMRGSLFPYLADNPAERYARAL